MFRRPVVAVLSTLVTVLALVGPANARPAPARVEPPATAAGRQLAWLLDASGRAPVAEAELRRHLSAGFLDAVGGPAAVNETLTTLGPLRLRAVLRSEPAAVQALTTARTAAPAATYVTDVAVDASGLVAALRFGPYTEAPASWAELESRVRALAPRVSFSTAEIGADGRCRTVRAVDGSTRRPLGSVFKLYVLGALGDAVAGGRAAWNEPLAIRDDWKSLPSGVMQDEPAGATYPLNRYADLMISISDNTATDHLIHRLGRQAVEAQVRRSGHGAPRATLPLLTTREFFTLKGTAYPTLANVYLALPRGLRPVVLPAVGRLPIDGIQAWTEPRKIDQIEWFGSPADVCNAYAGLDRRYRQPGGAPVGAALSINDGGVALDRSAFPEVWFKGGSEPGVLALTYLTRTADGRTFVASVLLSDPRAALSEAAIAPEAQALVRGALALAARR